MKGAHQEDRARASGFKTKKDNDGKQSRMLDETQEVGGIEFFDVKENL